MCRISIVMPVGNARRYVRAAAESVLASPRADLELVVVDDGSRDGSRQIVEGIADGRLRIVEGPGQGIAAAVNAGIGAAHGEIIMRCDADDEHVAERFEWQADWLSAHPDFDAVASGFCTIDARGRHVSNMAVDEPAGEITEELCGGRTRTHFCSFATRKTLLDAIGGSRPWFHIAEDVDLQLRLASAGRIWYEPKVTYRYRVHEASITHRAASTRRQFEDAAARRFAKQRQISGADDLMRGEPPEAPVAASCGTAAAPQIQGMLIGRAWRQHRAGEWSRALATGGRACRVRPTAWRAWRTLAALLVSRPGGSH